MADPVTDTANAVHGGITGAFNQAKGAVSTTASVAKKAFPIAMLGGLALMTADPTAMAELAGNLQTVDASAEFSEMAKATVGNIWNILSTSWGHIGSSATPEIIGSGLSDAGSWMVDAVSQP